MLKLHDVFNRAVLDGRGRASRFSCNYHNWVYRNDGSLMGVPDEANFFDLGKKKCGLVPIAPDVWEGWIFLNHQKQPEVRLQERSEERPVGEELVSKCSSRGRPCQ